MNKIIRLEQHINSLGLGEFLFIGRDFDIDEMQNILPYLENLEAKKIVEIVYQHKEKESGQRLVDLIKIQKC